jgi:Holliday junction resolvase RusA-like endonuclease
MSAVEFTVYGHPATAGSKRSFAVRRGGQFTGQTATTDDNPRTKSWQAIVASAALEASSGCSRGPLLLALAFYLHRPRAHYGTGRNSSRVRDSAPARPAVRPDLLKLTRAVEDALTGVLWHDDAQICIEQLSKHYAERDEPERVRVRVVLLAPEPLPLPGQLEIVA